MGLRPPVGQKGEVYLLGVKKVDLPGPQATPRAIGRFAIELFEGPVLIERVRFDFPMLGAALRPTPAGKAPRRSRRSSRRGSASCSPRPGEARSSSSSIAPPASAGRSPGHPTRPRPLPMEAGSAATAADAGLSKTREIC